MKSLVVYDSVYGNTEVLAKVIGRALAGEVEVKLAAETDPSELPTVDLLVIGSPTQAGRPTQPIQGLLKSLPDLTGVSVAAFDSRMSMWLARVFGFAAKRIAGAVKARGGTLVVPPQGFYVESKEGPLSDGEAERAADWARSISDDLASNKG